MNILGLSAYYHDAAACLIVDGKIIAAAQEERFTRKKHDSSFPINSIQYCIYEAGIKAEALDYIVFYDKPFLKFDRLLETYMAFAPKGIVNFITSLPIWLKEKLLQKKIIADAFKKNFGKEINWVPKILFSEHHLSHAASAFFTSPFKNAAVLTMDGVGEWTTTSLAIGSENKLTIQKEIKFPHSIGLLYSAFTYYTGFKVNSGEYKIMGLAPYGKPRFVKKIKDYLIDIKEDGSFHLNMKYFNFCTGLTMTNKNFDNLFGGPARKYEGKLTQREMDLAASVQAVIEEIIIKLAKNIKKLTGEENLCLAGGVALNCVANGKLLREKIFKNIWIQPASGDAGGSIGAALVAHYLMFNKPRVIRKPDGMNGSYLGPMYTQKNIEHYLKSIGAKFITTSDKETLKITAKALADGKAIGWHQGRMEFGPRALGNRSIIADARSPLMQKKLNLKVKYRESFRPFAPSILEDQLDKWFDLTVKSPYMLLVANLNQSKQILMTKKQQKLFGIKKLNVLRSKIPAVTHVDYSARIQTVSYKTNPKYYNLIKEFYKLTGCPLIVNTSFNIRGEPIVNTPEDSFRCFMGTGIDLLVIGNCILRKEDQKKGSLAYYKDRYDLD